ncbi:hypothetical protein ES288_A09G174700v1 [Gossypium darwinii]|uniref:Uncharacterized protein n=2 Tax=Gossypium TaxID=3633 RepID=A0A5D2P3U2_GOSTO|nr:hypothetical protein ES288_A09G174700v1 [Gossypium darwinii]TYI10872.1 hypothetical protein ES332_A09G170500v1 [Gossypium tomentosum]
MVLLLQVVLSDRDYRGPWVQGYTRSIGVCSVQEPLIWGTASFFLLVTIKRFQVLK